MAGLASQIFNHLLSWKRVYTTKTVCLFISHLSLWKKVYSITEDKKTLYFLAQKSVCKEKIRNVSVGSKLWKRYIVTSTVAFSSATASAECITFCSGTSYGSNQHPHFLVVAVV